MLNYPNRQLELPTMYVAIQIFHWLLLLVAVAGIVFCILLEGIVALDLLSVFTVQEARHAFLLLP